jgi:hypothetical protein
MSNFLKNSWLTADQEVNLKDQDISRDAVALLELGSLQEKWFKALPLQKEDKVYHKDLSTSSYDYRQVILIRISGSYATVFIAQTSPEIKFPSAVLSIMKAEGVGIRFPPSPDGARFRREWP